VLQCLCHGSDLQEGIADGSLPDAPPAPRRSAEADAGRVRGASLGRAALPHDGLADSERVTYVTRRAAEAAGAGSDPEGREEARLKIAEDSSAPAS
jgi:hypothetical protein